MIEYEVSLLIHCSRASMSAMLRSVESGIAVSPDPRDVSSFRLETRSPYVDCQIDFAVNDFLDSVCFIDRIEGVSAVDLKVCALFDPDKIAALNFELIQPTIARVAELGCTFNLWAMPVG